MLKISPKTSKWGTKSGLKMRPKTINSVALKDLTTSAKTRDLGRFCMLKISTKTINGGQNQGFNANQKEKMVRIERFDNLPQKGKKGEVLHVKNVAEKEEIGTKKKNWCQKQRTRCERKRQKRSH